jgi:SHS2 domain-containing protein
MALPNAIPHSLPQVGLTMPASKPRYEQLEHTADLALRIYGRTLRELFANAAFAMFSQLTDLQQTVSLLQREVEVEGIDYESLLVNWLNELLYLQDTRHEAYATFEIHRLSRRRLQATVRGTRTEDIHGIIKAATYHDLTIGRAGKGYLATVVFDV